MPGSYMSNENTSILGHCKSGVAKSLHSRGRHGRQELEILSLLHTFSQFPAMYISKQKLKDMFASLPISSVNLCGSGDTRVMHQVRLSLKSDIWEERGWSPGITLLALE